MTIGQALRKIRQNLDLTQKEMAANIVTRPFYAKVEAGKSRISADKLAAILFEHDVDITYFYQLLRATYTSKQKKIESDLNNKMEQAFNVGKIDEIESCYQEILSQSHSKILKLRAMISVAYLKNKLNQIDPKIKKDLFIEFNEGQNWMTNPELLRATYTSKQKKIESDLNNKMEQAFNVGKIDEIESCYQEILSQSHSKILKLRAMISVAYLKNKLNQIDPKIKKDLFIEFNEGQNWMTNPELLRLFTNTMPLWEQDTLAFFINRLLNEMKSNKNISELEQERYLRVFENYLAVCYNRKLSKKSLQLMHVPKIIDYIMESKPTIHFLLYKIAALYLKNLFLNNKEEAQKIRNEVQKYGYQDLIKTWPK